MKNRFLWGLLLALGCSPAMAQWVKIASNESSVFYIDPSASKKVGDHVMILILRDHTSVQYDRAELYLSSKDEIEVDCTGRRVRRIYSSDHPQHMGRGNFVYSEHGPMSWNKAAPKTILRRIVDIACLIS